MKKRITLLVTLACLISNISYSQSGWFCKFFNNTNTFSKIVKRDSINYLGLCGGKYYYKSTDGGNNWISNESISFDSSYSLYDGQFINSQTGWLVGSNSQYYGVILKTTNGGINWNRQNTGLGNWLCYCLFFLNENTGWIGTTNGSTTGWLIKTTNGGINWARQEFPGAYNVRSVKFLDSSNGWILGTYGLIAKTTDGGLTWLQKPVNNIPCSNSLYTTLFALSINEAWVLVDCVNQAMVYSHFYKTTNGGVNWNLMYSYTDSLTTNGHSFGNINFINNTTGFSNGDFNFIIRTSNSGLNWNRIDVVPVLGYYPIISSLLPINNNDIFAAGGYSGLGSYRPFNYILKSTNTGSNWQFKTYNWEFNFSKIYFVDNNTGYVISDTGKIFRTSNSGTNWSLVINNNNYGFRDISFANSSTGYLLGSAHFYNYYGKILKTTNNGTEWNEVFSSSSLPMYSIKFIDSQDGFVGCDSNRLLKTTNAGLNWSLINLINPIPYSILSISFINNTTGWILGNYYIYQPWGIYGNNAFWKTTNAGNNWNIVFDSAGYRYNYFIQFLDNNNGYKYSWDPTRIQKTTNGGMNWFTMALPNYMSPRCLYFIDANTGWVAGSNGQFSGEVAKTTNSGITWTWQFNEYNKIVNSLFAFNSNNAWFCGDYSSVYKTTNGGGIIGINNISTRIPNSFSLSQNYPNPFNPVTKIKFSLPHPSKGGEQEVRLIIYDLLGREVTTLVNEPMKPGTYEIDWDGSNYASGVYFYKLVTDEYVETRKMVLLK